MKKGSILGVGISDADYPVGRSCPYYKTWLSMLERCYSPRNLGNRPTYVGCTVVEAWHRFSTFRIWMEQQDWQGKQLDKDLLVIGNKVYGPDTCIFVSLRINSLMSGKNPKHLYPVGVFPQGNRFKASIFKNGRSTHLGVYDTTAEASKVYRTVKAELITDVATVETCPRIKAALMRVVTNLLI